MKIQVVDLRKPSREILLSAIFNHIDPNVHEVFVFDWVDNPIFNHSWIQIIKCKTVSRRFLWCKPKIIKVCFEYYAIRFMNDNQTIKVANKYYSNLALIMIKTYPKLFGKYQRIEIVGEERDDRAFSND
jgi:hypothetical protein